MPRSPLNCCKEKIESEVPEPANCGPAKRTCDDKLSEELDPVTAGSGGQTAPVGIESTADSHSCNQCGSSNKTARSAIPSVEKATSSRTPGIAASLLERFAQEYLLDCDYRLQSPKTIETRRIFLKNLVWFLKHRSYEICGTHELRQFFVYLAHGHEEEGGRFGNKQLKRAVRPTTHKDYWVNFKCFFNWLVEESLIESSPMARLPKPKVPQEHVEPFTMEQVKAILEAARRSLHPRRNEAIVLFLLDTGVRASELCNLTVDNVDFQSRRAYVTGKGNKRRAVFFSRQTAAALSNYLRHEKRYFGECRQDCPVFTQYRGASKGAPLTVDGLRHRVEHLITEAGIKGGKKSPHRFRHTCALWMLNNGSNIYHLKELLGHSSLTTCQTYLRISQADVQNHHAQFSPVESLRKKERRSR